MINFHPREVVDRGSETQFQVSEKIKKENLARKCLDQFKISLTGCVLSPDLGLIYCWASVVDAVPTLKQHWVFASGFRR